MIPLFTFIGSATVGELIHVFEFRILTIRLSICHLASPSGLSPGTEDLTLQPYFSLFVFTRLVKDWVPHTFNQWPLAINTSKVV